MRCTFRKHPVHNGQVEGQGVPRRIDRRRADNGASFCAEEVGFGPIMWAR